MNKNYREDDVGLCPLDSLVWDQSLLKWKFKIGIHAITIMVPSLMIEIKIIKGDLDP